MAITDEDRLRTTREPKQLLGEIQTKNIERRKRKYKRAKLENG
jgi:hypothetical protein